jgi:glycosyltransferase involved in cell wall biosynthesis
MSSRFAIDSIALRDDLAFGWGWFLADAAPAAHLRIVIRHRSGPESRLVCSQGGSRTDIEAAHPDIPHAGSAGFIVQGRIRGEWAGARSELQAELTDGTRLALPIDGFPFRFMEAAANVESLRAKAAAALALLRAGDIGGFLHRAWRVLAGAWRRRLPQPTLAAAQPASRRMRVIFDHAMGGGANRFRERLAADIAAAGGCACIVVPDLPKLAYRLRILDANGSTESSCGSLSDLLGFLDCQQLDAIELNDLVSFDDPLAVAAWSLWHAQHGVPVRVYLHDFHVACPSWTLIDADGRYCGVPAPEVCARCLPRLEIPFLALLPPTDIPQWRAAWSALLHAAERIVAFSAASIAILRRAYPDLDPSRIALRPHTVDYLPVAAPAPVLSAVDQARPLVIGVVGNISRHKGSDIVWEMAALIHARQLPVRIAVIGAIENAVHSAVVRVLGPYRAEQLPQLLAEAGVDVCLLPSVCPETYSYVTAELMQLQMPLAVFDLGAPAERVAGYARGRIIPEVSAHAALATIHALHRDLLADAVPGRLPQRA